MTVRAALIGSMLAVGAVTTALVGVLGVVGINRNVRQQAQERVNYDLRTVRSHYERQLDLLADRIESSASQIDIPSDENGESRLKRNDALQDEVEWLKHRLGLSVLNVCDVEGRAIAGDYPDAGATVPVNMDPVLRRALGGEPASGTVILDAERLQLEGGGALRNSVLIEPTNGKNGGAGTAAGHAVKDAMSWWAAAPLRDAGGRVIGLLYGGQALNMNFDLVDEVRGLVFGPELYDGKPLGTVTIFMRDVRVATNVLGPDRRRAVGTEVSDEVAEKVLNQGEVWHGPAKVVDTWYISAYEPVRDPDGAAIGMLYVGLLEAPYNDLRGALIRQVMLVLAGVAVVSVTLAIALVSRITRPLKELSSAAAVMAAGERDHRVETPGAYAEIAALTHVFRDMQHAIAERDRHLNEQNAELAEANEKLERANRNYIETLGFVTHELKSPLAAMQTMINAITEGYTGEVPEQTAEFLRRIKRNCEELQDMVKNYLDLSRAERGELVAHKSEIELRAEVIDPSVEHAMPLFDSRSIKLEVECPAAINVFADAEVMRIALSNYLSNAAKYGAEGTTARLEIREENGDVLMSVWNEGAGFTPEEGESLFGKFTRLKNKNTRGKRGSGLGLFLTRRIVERHGGKAWAESEPGQWARFSMRIPKHGREAE